MNRRLILTLAAGLAFAPWAAAHASESDFTAGAFKAAQHDGKRILVDVWASWCPTCKAQGPVLQTLLAKPENKDVVVLRVNFDTQADVLRAFKVQQQSTLIMFKGDRETARSTGETDAGPIAQLVASSR